MKDLQRSRMLDSLYIIAVIIIAFTTAYVVMNVPDDLYLGRHNTTKEIK